MIVLHLCGRRAEALHVYHRTRQLLDDELGLQPAAELRDVAGHILAGSAEDPMAMVAGWADAAVSQRSTR
jgi:DNA-binding SARP family transcriptional activator